MPQKTDIFKHLLIPFVLRENYDFSENSGIFREIVFSGFEKMGYRKHCFSLMDIAKGFLFELAPTFSMTEIIDKFWQGGIEGYEKQIIWIIQEKISNETYINEKIINTLAWGKFLISVPVGNKAMRVDLSKLLRCAFSEELLREMQIVFSCLKKSERSQILKQIHLSDYETGDALKRLFERDSDNVKNGGRNQESLKKFLDAMEPFSSVAYDGYLSKKYS